MKLFQLPSWFHARGARVASLLALTLLAINGIAVWEILAEKQAAEHAAAEEIRLRAVAQARTIDAALESLRGDFLFLSQSPPLARVFDSLANVDPMRRRWGRLDVDGALLLFLDAHPAVERILVFDRNSHVALAAGRRAGGSIPLPADPATAARPRGRPLLAGHWPLDAGRRGGGTLVGWVDPRRLAATAAPGEPGLILAAADQANQAPPGVSVPLSIGRFESQTPLVLVRRDDRERLTEPARRIARAYRATALLNLAVMSLALLLGLLAFRQVRRSAALEADAAYQLKLRELERQVLHSERLASVGRFASGIAHEVANPLEGMANYLAVLEEDLREGDPREALEQTAQVREGLNRMAAIIRQVLILANPGAGPRSALDLREILEMTAEFLRSNPAFRRVTLRLEGSGEPLRVSGNPTTLGQLFLNLFVNGCQAQQGGGWLEVRAGRTAGQVVVEVEDGGPGISPEASGRLFEPFFSTRGSAGLGLSICQQIVTEHGGSLSAGGGRVGARFTVLLPEEAAS